MAKTPEADAPRAKSLLDQLREGLEIDKHNLDECWVEQPDIFYRVAKGLADANAAVNEAAANLKQLIATTDARIREEAGEKKITEAAILKEIDIDSEVVDARLALGKLEHTAAKWGALKEAFSQRSYALKDLTSLHIANYYQTNSGGAARDQQADTNRSKGGEERRNRPKG